jgi:hypothetical protein
MYCELITRKERTLDRSLAAPGWQSNAPGREDRDGQRLQMPTQSLEHRYKRPMLVSFVLSSISRGQEGILQYLSRNFYFEVYEYIG